MEPDEITWVDTVPVQPPRTKRITIGEFEWSRAAAADGGPAILSARFWINGTELVAVLVEDTTPGLGASTGQMDAPRPRARIGGRTYQLSVEAPAQDSTG